LDTLAGWFYDERNKILWIKTKSDNVVDIHLNIK